MKAKFMKRILSMTLAFVLILGSTVWGADAQLTKVGEVSSVSLPTQELTLQDNLFKTQSVSGTGMVNFPVKEVKRYQQMFGDDQMAQVTATGNKAYFEFQAPVTGHLLIRIFHDSDNLVPVTFYPVNNPSKITTVSNNLSSSSDGMYACLSIKKNERYQLCLSNMVSGDRAMIIGAAISGSTAYNLAKLGDNDFYLASGVNEKQSAYTTYWKVTIKSNGLLMISTGDISSILAKTSEQPVKVTLCDKNKKQISPQATLSSESDFNGVASFGVTGNAKTGTVYYVKVQTKAPVYGIRYDTTTYATNPGTSKKKATTISVGKSKKATLAASTKKATQWYKFKVSKNKWLKVNFTGMIAVNSKVKMSVLDSKGKKVKFTYNGKKTTSLTLSHNLNTGYISGSFKKGTYYVTIEKVSTQTSAAYELSVK
jgi:hypothetical protein